MTDSIAGFPFWDVTFDEDGDPDTRTTDALLAETGNLTDLYVFSHGWNNEHRTARRLYDAFFTVLGGQLAADPRGTAGSAGAYCPSKLWSAEPSPDFEAAAATGGGGGVASVGTGDAD